MSHVENVRVCLKIFMAALRNKKKNSPILAKNTPPYFDSALLVLWLLALLQRAYLLPKFPVQKFLMTHILIHHDTRQWKTSMVTLPPLQTEPHQGPHWHLTSTNWWSDDVVVNIPIQTLVFLPWLLFYKIIISQLELGLPV